MRLLDHIIKRPPYRPLRFYLVFALHFLRIRQWLQNHSLRFFVFETLFNYRVVLKKNDLKKPTWVFLKKPT